MKTKIETLLKSKENCVYNITENVKLYNFIDNKKLMLKLDLTTFETVYYINENESEKIKNEIMCKIITTVEDLKEKIINELENELNK